MKKIGLLTYFGDLNPGTNLQAYSIYIQLKNIYGPDYKIEIINILSFRRWNLPLFSSLTIVSLFKELIKILKYKSFRKNYFNYSKKRLVTDNYEICSEYISNLGYSAIYVGSDTLLELFRIKKDDLTIFYLPPNISANKYFIAASCRDTSIESLSENQKNKMCRSITNFNGWGVRDEATRRLMTNFVQDSKIDLIPDPTFTYEIDYSYADAYIKRKGIDISKEKLICVHLIRGFKWRWDLVNKLKKDGYKIVSIRPFREADYEFNDMSPLEFSGIFKYFQITITHRFHDSVFSLKNLTPLVVLPPGAEYSNSFGESKYSSLCKDFDILNTSYVHDPFNISTNELYQIINNNIHNFNKKHVEQILDKKKSKFVEYLFKTKQDYDSKK